MSFRWLSQEALQDAIGVELIGRLEALAPVLDYDGADIVEIYRKDNLVKLLEAFGTSGLMKDREFLREYFGSMPMEAYNRLAGAENVGLLGVEYADGITNLLRKGWSSPEHCSRLCEVLGLPQSIVPAPHRSVASVESIKCSASPFKQLLSYQYEVMTKCSAKLAPSRSRLILQMPTGAGKTRTAFELIAAHLNESEQERRVVWLAHSEELCEQAIECATETWQHLGRYDLRVRRMFGGSHALPCEGSELIVASFQTLYARAKAGDPWDGVGCPVSMVVVDEAHKVLAPTYHKVTDDLIGDSTKVLGLTATPGRGVEDVSGNQALVDYFFGTIVSMEGPAGENAIEYLRGLKVLSHVSQDAIESPSVYELSATELRALEKTHDYPAGLLQRIGSDDLRNLEILRKLREVCSEGHLCLFFACSVEHSRFICAILNYLGISSRHVDGATDKGERQAIIQGYREGRFQVLCNYGVLATGFDAPLTDAVFIARPTKSIVLYSQMLGRGLRGPRVGGTASCRVINVRDNIQGLPSNDEIFDFFEDYWSPPEG